MLHNIRDLSKKELAEIIKINHNSNDSDVFRQADDIRKKYYGNKVYIRGLIEFTNYCKNNCYYCGLQCRNKSLERYRLDKNTILKCCEYGYKCGFKTFVLQGGEDLYYTDEKMEDIIYSIKSKYPDCALTLSVGEKDYKTYKRYFDAGADRFLLRHETADKEHYSKLHPNTMSFENRIKCLYNLKSIGFQTGAGFMVGSPYQSYENLADDLLFIKKLRPEMVGIGPFIPQKQTIFAHKKTGDLKLTLVMLALTRIMLENVLLPSTTALATISKQGRIKGLQSGCNVIMPNLSPFEIRKNYAIYDNKAIGSSETVENLNALEKEIISAGYIMDMSRGDFKRM